MRQHRRVTVSSLEHVVVVPVVAARDICSPHVSNMLCRSCPPDCATDGHKASARRLIVPYALCEDVQEHSVHYVPLVL